MDEVRSLLCVGCKVYIVEYLCPQHISPNIQLWFRVGVLLQGLGLLGLGQDSWLCTSLMGQGRVVGITVGWVIDWCFWG